MSAAKIKGRLLEFIIRRLLTNCGFTKVKPDGFYIYQPTPNSLTMINGKGAEHDADVLMNPPIQMPFSYPSRILFECKAYKTRVSLTIIRNALGLRYDINEFEIVSKGDINKRKNSRRKHLAITNRQRFQYQVGVASIKGFTKDAQEFAANNKIPLISLSWFLPKSTCDLFDELNDDYISQFSETAISQLNKYLISGNDIYARDSKFFTDEENLIYRIMADVKEFEANVLIGLLESGDMIFIFSEEEGAKDYISEHIRPLSSTYHYTSQDRDRWTIVLDGSHQLNFHLPLHAMQKWKEQSMSKEYAREIKDEMFSTIFIFVQDRGLPFRMVKLNRGWFDGISNNEE